MASPTLFIVDDEEEMATFVSDVASDLGFETKVAHSAKEMMKLVEKETPAAIVMDVVMPDMDGVELIQWLGKTGCAAPVIVMSGYHPGYVNLVGSMGNFHGVTVIGSLNKPFSASELEMPLKQVLDALQ